MRNKHNPRTILLTGQCTLHWGRMEFGNIGNYYIIEPFFRELHRTFPGAEIRTTFQMSDAFRRREGVSVLPMDLYYSWSEDDLEIANKELALAKCFAATGNLPETTPYIEEVLRTDLVINFSGDLWGDNANLLGQDRFMIGLCKDRTAQLLNRPVVMLAGSPGPFGNQATTEFAKEVFDHYALVTNREPLSTRLLQQNGFAMSKVKTLACPAFLFTSSAHEAVNRRLCDKLPGKNGRHLVGFVLCGWNFATGPFDRWPRSDSEYSLFASAIEYIENSLGATVCLISHSNGFPPHPASFELQHGRDYPIIKQLQEVVQKRGLARHVLALDGIYTAKQTKAIIGSFDMLVSGRIHAAVAGLTQYVPTVIMNYGHEPKAHKLRGFASVVGVERYVADPSNLEDLKTKVQVCWENHEQLRTLLQDRIPQVQALARSNFSEIRTAFQSWASAEVRHQ